jgi:DNA-binding NarL/FixJ family response regulator
MTALLLNHSAPTAMSVSDNHDRGVNILVADDRRSRSYGIWATLSSLRDVPTITTGENIGEVLRLAIHHPFEVSLVSARFGSGEGFNLAHRLKEHAARPAVLIYSDAMDPVLAGAAIVAGADGVFAWEADAAGLGELIGRVLRGEKLFPPLLPDPFEELARHVAEEDRRIVAMLLERAHPDAIASLCNISAQELTLRRQALVERMDAAYARASTPQPGPPSSPRRGDDRLAAVPRPVVFG